MLFFVLGVHLFSHVFNAYNYSMNYNWRYPDVNAASRPNEVVLGLRIVLMFSTGFLAGLVSSMLCQTSIESFSKSFNKY